jgi:hypothetical protein
MKMGMVQLPHKSPPITRLIGLPEAKNGSGDKKDAITTTQLLIKQMKLKILSCVVRYSISIMGM